jgi:hypothetical protein
LINNANGFNGVCVERFNNALNSKGRYDGSSDNCNFNTLRLVLSMASEVQKYSANQYASKVSAYVEKVMISHKE